MKSLFEPPQKAARRAAPAASPTKWVAAGSEEIPRPAKFSAQAGNAAVRGISELVQLSGYDSKKYQAMLRFKQQVRECAESDGTDTRSDSDCAREIDEFGEVATRRITHIQKRFTPEEITILAEKYSAGQSTRKLAEEFGCNRNSFVSEDDYPELVAALGKLTPGVDSYSELLKSSTSEQISNLCIVDGTVWVYLIKSKKLVGLSDSGKKEIAVTGANGLFESTTVDVVLSISRGALFLGQNSGGADSYLLYECAAFNGTKASIEVVQLDVVGKRVTASNGATEFANYCIPRVTVVRGTAYVVLGYSKP